MLPVYYWTLWEDKHMNKIKNIGTKWLATAMVFALMIALTGCMGEQVGIVYNSDGSCSYTTKYLLEETAYNYMTVVGDGETYFFQSADYQQNTETINGKKYHSYSRSFTFSSYDAMKSFLTEGIAYLAGLKNNSANPAIYDDLGEDSAPFSSLTMDANGFVAEMNPNGELPLYTEEAGISQAELQKAGYATQADYYSSLGILLDISLTLPAPVLESNGAISGNTVTWNLNSMPVDRKLIAFTSGNPITGDTEPPVISGVKENKMYGEVEVVIKDNVSLKSIIVDDVTYYKNNFYVSNHGKHTIVATDINNNSTTVNFRVDAKKPKIKGVKNGKTYKKPVTLRFSDASGIKAVYVNEKKSRIKRS